MTPFIIRRASAADAAALAELGARTFIDSFALDNRPEDIAAYVARTYGELRQRREIEDAACVTLLAKSSTEAIGYAQLRRGDAPPCVDGPAPVELARFYIVRAWHGSGAAQELMRAVQRAVLELEGMTLWLGVWERNARAIRFYEKCGFRSVGTQPFLLGSDLQTDIVMAVECGRPRPHRAGVSPAR